MADRYKKGFRLGDHTLEEILNHRLKSWNLELKLVEKALKRYAPLYDKDVLLLNGSVEMKYESLVQKQKNLKFLIDDTKKQLMEGVE